MANLGIAIILFSTFMLPCFGAIHQRQNVMACTEEYAPVCATRPGRFLGTFGNRCFAERDGYEVIHDGICGRDCMMRAIYAPLCGTDNRSYSNEDEAACYGVTKQYLGMCSFNCSLCTDDDDRGGPVCGVDNGNYASECQANCRGVSVALGNHRPCPEGTQRCDCSTGSHFGPVCGTDARDYDNECLAICSGVRVRHFDSCRYDCTLCPDGGDPVCGINTVTYDNECKATCLGVPVASQGSCPEGSQPCTCPANYEPVCGIDGNTYGNVCQAVCSHTRVDYEGPCRHSKKMIKKAVYSMAKGGKKKLIKVFKKSHVKAKSKKVAGRKA